MMISTKHNRELREKADRLVAELCAPQMSRKTNAAITTSSQDTEAIINKTTTKKNDKITSNTRLYTRPEFENKLQRHHLEQEQQQQQHQLQRHQQEQQQKQQLLQAHQQEQAGKRTLIKNQLYLIEQLQLENADLRNERDQLQLENEELKFQLQMIR